MLSYLFSEFLPLQIDKILPIWSISWVFRKHSLSTFWDILGSNSIYGPGGKEMVREAPEKNLYDIMRQIPWVKSVYDFLSDEGRRDCFISLA